jgi:hypothetical protein
MLHQVQFLHNIEVKSFTGLAYQNTYESFKMKEFVGGGGGI